jgi:hypothetical protein
MWDELTSAGSQQQDKGLMKMMQSKRERRELLGLVQILEMHKRLASLPYQRSRTKGQLKTPSYFTPVEFLEQFCFRKAHLECIVACLLNEEGNLLVQNGEDQRLYVGTAWHWSRVRADTALMVFLSRMAYPCRWCNLTWIIGGTISVLSETFNYMVCILFDRYAPMAGDIWLWKRMFRRFAQ